MGHAIVATFSAAIGIAISPTPILGLIAFLTARGGRRKGIAYAIGWFAAVWITTFLLSVAGNQTPIAGDRSDGNDGTSSWAAIQIVLGLAFVAFAIRTFVNRPRGASATRTPGWMSAVDRTSAFMAFLTGAAFSILNPKNLPLDVSAAGEFAAADLSTGDIALAATIFGLLASASAFGLVLFALLARDPSNNMFAGLRALLLRHNAVILAVIFGLAGFYLFGRGISLLLDR